MAMSRTDVIEVAMELTDTGGEMDETEGVDMLRC